MSGIQIVTELTTSYLCFAGGVLQNDDEAFCKIYKNFKLISAIIYVTGGRFKSNGTTRVPMSVSRLVLDKVRLLYSSELICSNQI